MAEEATAEVADTSIMEVPVEEEAVHAEVAVVIEVAVDITAVLAITAEVLTIMGEAP